MFEQVGHSGKQPEGPKVRDLVGAILRSPITQGLAGLLAAGAILLAVYVTFIYRQALSESCNEIPKVEFDMAEIIALKRRREAYQRNPLPDAQLDLTGSELTFLLRNKAYSFKMYLELFDDEATIRAAMPRDDGLCYNIEFHGRARIDEGVLTLWPDLLRVGEADLSWLAQREEGWRFEPEDMPDEKAGDVLANVRLLTLEHGEAIIQVYDRYAPL